MNLIDKAILEWSYKTTKGYPDINSQEDMALFESMFGFNIINESIKSQGAKAVSDLVNDLGSKYKFHQLKSKKWRLGSPENSKPEFFVDLFKDYFNTDNVEVLGPRRSPNDSGKFNGYKFKTEKYGEILIIVSTQEIGGTGVGNEQLLADKVTSAFIDSGEEPITVKFVGDNKTLEFTNVTGATKMGEEGGSSWRAAKAAREVGGDYDLVKGDVQLHAKGKNISLSIKQSGSFRWESAKTRYPDIFRNFMEKGIKGEIPNLELKASTEIKNLLLMWNPNNDKPYGKVFVKGIPPEDTKSMAFGSDNAKIIQRTFAESDFNLSNRVLTITVDKAVDSLADFKPEDLPEIEFERNASKVVKSDIDPMNVKVQRGIGIRTVPRSRLSHGARANVLILDLKDIM